jgi:CHAD domain-containing protein
MKKKLYRTAPVGINHSVIALIDKLQTHLGKPVRGRGYVHRIRVDIKRLRAWIRLIRNEEDTVGLRDIDRDLRDVMKKLSSHRDRQALLETLKWLEKKTSNDINQSPLRVVRSHMRAGSGRITVDWTDIKTTLIKVLDTLEQLTQKFESVHMARDGLQRTYKRSARLGDRAFSGKINPEDVHAFRKWAKYLYYQLEIIQIAYPKLYNETLENLEDLGNRLGRYHDLVLLKEKLDQLPAKKRNTDAAKRMEVMIEERMHKLLRRAHRLYRKTFSASSSKFVVELP